MELTAENTGIGANSGQPLQSQDDGNRPCTPPPAYYDKHIDYPVQQGGPPITVPHVVVLCQEVPVGSANSGPDCNADYKVKWSYIIGCILFICCGFYGIAVIISYITGAYRLSLGIQTTIMIGISAFMAFLAAHTKRNGLILALFVNMAIAVVCSLFVVITGLVHLVILVEHSSRSDHMEGVGVPILASLMVVTTIVWVTSCIVFYITFPTVKHISQRCTCCRTVTYAGQVVNPPHSGSMSQSQQVYQTVPAPPPYTASMVTPAV